MKLNALTLDQIRDWILDTRGHDRDTLLRELEALHQCHPRALGYGFSPVHCTACGAEYKLIHPIPLAMPTQCRICKHTGLYFD